MFSSRFSWTRQVGTRLTLGFCVLFVIGSAIVFLIVYSLFSKTLTQRDHDYIKAKGKEYAAIFQKDGWEGLSMRVDDDHLADVLIRVEDASGETIFFEAPLNPEHFDISMLDRVLSEKTEDRWTTIPGRYDSDELEVLTIHLDDGGVLQMGMSADHRQDLLESLQQIFAATLLLTVAVGVICGFLFSNRVLSPVRHLISTIETIQGGDLHVRVPQPNSGDEMEELVSLFNEMLNRIQQLIRGMAQTLDNVSHDLRTPLTRFRSIAEEALKGPDFAENYREALTQCLEESDEIIAMINSLMDISEAESGTMKLNVEPFATSRLLSEVKELYEMVAEEKGIALLTECQAGSYLHADRMRLKQVLANLVDNAVKYTNDGGSVRLSVRQARNFGATIMVEDTGPGIDQQELPRIWDRLYRGDQSRSTRGLGLGLSLVSSIVRAHGGSVHVDSELGHGSRFIVELPNC